MKKKMYDTLTAASTPSPRVETNTGTYVNADGRFQ